LPRLYAVSSKQASDRELPGQNDVTVSEESSIVRGAPSVSEYVTRVSDDGTTGR
jgi:hypothetical protein